MPGFQIEALVPVPNRKGFSSGSEPLDRHFQTLVTQDIKRRLCNCFVALDDTGEIAGFYTFSASSLPMSELSVEEAKRLPRYPSLPAGLIGRLAVDQRFQGRRLGSSLVMDAFARAQSAETAIFALVVDAKDEAAAEFYAHLGFTRFSSRAGALYLPVATGKVALGKNRTAI